MFVTLDTTRADHLGLYGYFRDTSPNLDAFAADALVFDRALAPIATTLPSHLSLFTATHPLEHGVLSNPRRRRRWKLTPSLQPLAAACREAGLRTAAFVSAAPLRAGSGIEWGFERFDEPPPKVSARDGAATTDAALAWLAGVGDEPYLLWVHYYDAHWPLMPAPSHVGLFSTDAELERWFDERQISERTFYEGVPVVHPRRTLNLYAAEVHYQDEQLGRLLEALQARPDWSRTTVVITGDHGEGLSQHGQGAHGRTWDEQLRVPLVMRVPGEAPRRVGSLTSLLDVLPTLAGLLDFPALDALLDQASGRDALRDPDPGVVSLDGGDQLGRPGYREALTTPHWKLFRTELAKGVAHHQLFDLESDPFELEDVAKENPEVVEELARELEAELAAKRERGQALAEAAIEAEPLEPDLAEQLRELGYADDEDEGS